MMKRLGFLETKRTPRYSMRKLNVGMASVLLGVTIFGINFTNHSVKAATIESVTQKATSKVPEAATTLQSAPKTQGSAGSGVSGSSATEVVSGSQGSNSQAASATSSAANASQAAPETQVPAPAASQRSESANSGNATSSPASQAGTVSANQTSNTSAAGAPASSDQTVTVDETTLPATQAAMLLTNFARTNIETDTPLPPTTQTYDKVEQPLLYDYGLHVSATGTRDGQTWVDKTVAKGRLSLAKIILVIRWIRFLGQLQIRGSLPAIPTSISLRRTLILVNNITG